MLDVERIQFTVRKEGHEAHVIGRLSLGCALSVSQLEIRMAKDEVIEDAKKRIKQEYWRRMYGELEKPLYFLERSALMHAGPTEVHGVQDAVTTLRALLKGP
jgi:hypothetical protein